MLSSDDAHLVDGHFDLDRIIGLLGQALNQALHDGYQGVVATGKSQEFGPDRVFCNCSSMNGGRSSMLLPWRRQSETCALPGTEPWPLLLPDK